MASSRRRVGPWNSYGLVDWHLVGVLAPIGMNVKSFTKSVYRAVGRAQRR